MENTSCVCLQGPVMMNGYEKPVTNKVLRCLFCEYTINISLNTDFFFSLIHAWWKLGNFKQTLLFFPFVIKGLLSLTRNIDRLYPGCNKYCAFQTGRSTVGNCPGVVVLLVILFPEFSVSLYTAFVPPPLELPLPC